MIGQGVFIVTRILIPIVFVGLGLGRLLDGKRSARS